MKNRFLMQAINTSVLGGILLFYSTVYAENIDPFNDSSQYAWTENAGWINFEPQFGPGVTVTDTELTGYAWGENTGWINLKPSIYGGVINDGGGNLSGYAWGENVGWINFNPNFGGVKIDENGNFNGWAWGENIGWVHFQNISVPYKVQTTWAPTSSSSSTTTTTACICPPLCIFGEGSDEVELLRYYRDNVLSQTAEGQELIKLYYQWSHIVARAIEEDDEFKEEVEDIVDGILLLIKGGLE